MGRELTLQKYKQLLLNPYNYTPIAKIELLRYEDESVQSAITDKLLTGSSLTITNQQGCRRSISLILDNSDASLIPKPNNGKLWLNTKFNFYLGIMDNYSGDYKYIPMGTFCLAKSEPELISDISGGYKLNLKADDKWSLLDTALGNMHEIPQDSSIVSTITALLKECGDTKPPVLENLPDKAPYTMQWDGSQTYAQVIRDLANLYSRDCYYNETGNLIFEEFQDVSTSAIQWEFRPETGFQQGCTRVYKNDKVYNRVVVTSSNNSKTYQATAENNDLTSFTRVGFIPTNTHFIQDDNIYSDNLAKQRAEAELKKDMRLQETITLKSFLIPHLKVNRSILVTDNSIGLNNARYAIQEIQMQLDFLSVMTVTGWLFNDTTDFQDLTSESGNQVSL